MGQAADTRDQRILDAALGLILRYGYDKTAMSDIAAAAGVSKGALYLHFDSKEALFEALLLRELEHYTADWLSRVEADPQGGTMGGIYRHILHAINANPFIEALFKRDRQTLGKYLSQTEKYIQLDQVVATRAEFIRKMQASGVVRADVDPYITAYLMTIFVSGLLTMDEQLPAAAIPDIDALLLAMGDMMDRYLATGTPTDSDAGKRAIRETLAEARRLLKREPPGT